ncbi:MAG: sensor domain-containing diguanylate cyclase [Candidatus Acidiferrales bacterium]
MGANSRGSVKKPGTPSGSKVVLKGPASRRRPLRVLFVHSNAADAEQCVQELKRAHFKVSEDVASVPARFTELLDSKSYDVVLVEYPTANWQGPRPLQVLHAKNKQIPLIFLTGALPLETAAKLITQGAADCVEMDHVGHLPVAVRRALSENNLRQERDQSEKKLRHSEARYRALVGNLTYGICRCNSEGKFLDVNQALVTMLGYPSKEELLESVHARDILCNSAKRGQLLGHSGEEDGLEPLEIDWKRKDGTALKVRLSGREVGDEGEMEGYEIIVEDVTQQRKLEDHLRQQAAKDPLTGLANYRHLIEVIDAEIRRSERTAREFAILFLDLDGLKQINDRFGHVVGSQALCRLADVLGNSSRDIDTAARFGGDEFAVVLPETGAEPASLVGRRICDSLANDGREPRLSVSVGMAVYPKDGETVDALVGAADSALYAMKAKARDRDASREPFSRKAAAGRSAVSVNSSA